MGYLDPYLINNRAKIVSCNELYWYLLRVQKETNPVDAITKDISDLRVCLIVKEAVPDVEEWQYAGETSKNYLIRFHRAADRDQAQALLKSRFFKTSTRDLKP